MNVQLTHGSLFSGIGGFDLGAERAGVPTLWNCEVDPRKRQILARHFPETQQYEDIKTMLDVPNVDIISGGFPCQNISVSNSSKTNRDKHGNIKGIKGERSSLWAEYARIINIVKPRYVLIENSPMLLRRGLEYVLSDLSSLGYDAEWKVLPAAAFGHNHQRKRLYIIAYASGIRWASYPYAFRELPKNLHKSQARTYPLSFNLQRFNAQSDFSRIRVDDGLPRGLDTKRIEDCGNAVVPAIAQYLFECIKHIEQERQ